ncbi:hypothetical protein BN3589_05123 [Clostridium sp. C105KSO14]|nr:hypothetical protein BN3589_05123 [Clostridium sp. C105KSO14]
MLFFFFKQKTAYEMLRSLVGSEMCIRDRCRPRRLRRLRRLGWLWRPTGSGTSHWRSALIRSRRRSYWSRPHGWAFRAGAHRRPP